MKPSAARRGSPSPPSGGWCCPPRQRVAAGTKMSKKHEQSSKQKLSSNQPRTASRNGSSSPGGAASPVVVDSTPSAPKRRSSAAEVCNGNGGVPSPGASTGTSADNANRLEEEEGTAGSSADVVESCSPGGGGGGGRGESASGGGGDSSDTSIRNSKSPRKKPNGETPVSDRQARTTKTCCFCCSCSCLSVKEMQNKRPQQGLSSLDHYFNGDSEAPPTLEEIRMWGESFDRLMKCTAGRKVFREFLQCEYSEENILFWLACEDLKAENNPDMVEEKARLIYEDYISILSPKEVSLDSRVREVINRNMVQPTAHTFDEAQVQIYTLMHRDSYPRFVNSTIYRKLAQLPCPSRKGSVI